MCSGTFEIWLRFEKLLISIQQSNLLCTKCSEIELNELKNEKKLKYLNSIFILTEHEDGRRSGEISRTVLWNSEFFVEYFVCIAP